jgi:acyl-CoA reductase-like NAD-dependent aldehyde dehydrogenase
LGGKTPLIVFDDADLDALVPQLVMASILMNGQFCCTGSRVLVQRGIADELRTRLAAALEAVRVGPAEAPPPSSAP